MPSTHPSPDRRRDERELAAAMRSVSRLRQEQGLEPTPGRHAPTRAASRPRRSRLLTVGAGIAALVVLLQQLGGGGEGQASAAPYDRPPSFTPGEGEFAFLATHPVTDLPIGFDPCRPVRYLVNPEGGPSDWRELVETGVAHVEWASGLDFVDAGTTTSQRPFDPDRVDRALGEQPVVIGFADEAELPGLAGDVVALGGGVPMNMTNTHAWFGTGSIALDTDYFDGPSTGSERVRLQSVVDHEFGHVVGLDHVDDPARVMHAGDERHADHFGPGDLEGMARLAALPCR